MSSFKITITLESSLSSQELADFFTALAKSEQGDVQPLVRILHPVEPPPLPPAPAKSDEQPKSEEQTPEAPKPVIQEVPITVTNAKNTMWERSDITLVDDAAVTRIIQQIELRELMSQVPSVSWTGPKFYPNSQHNVRIRTVLKGSPNRTLSFTSLGAQAGIPDKDKLKCYLREMEKQGLITAKRRVF